MNDALLKAILLMVIGMATVFAFLVLLVFAMQGLSRVLPRLSWMLPDPEPAKPRANAAPVDSGAAVALAIAAALRRRAGSGR